MIKIEVTGESIVELADKLRALATQFGASSVTINPVMPEVIEATKPKAAKKKAEPKSEPQEEAGNEPSATEQPLVEPAAPTENTPAAPSEPALDFEKDVGPIVVEAVTSKGREAVVGVLSQFGAERASEVPEAQWAELVEALKAL